MLQAFAFQFLRPASLSYQDHLRWGCPGLVQPPPNAPALAPLDARFNFLLILGAQKAGTTWLFDALATHPLFVGATHGYRCARPPPPAPYLLVRRSTVRGCPAAALVTRKALHYSGAQAPPMWAVPQQCRSWPPPHSAPRVACMGTTRMAVAT